LKAITEETAGIRRRIGDELHILSTKTKEGLDALDREFIERENKFEKWRLTEYQQAVNAFQDRSNDLRHETLDNLQNKLDPLPNGMLIKPITDRLRRSDENAKHRQVLLLP
jgi:hypothetical protein